MIASKGACSVADRHVIVAQRVQPLLGFLRKLRNDLDAVHFLADLGQHGRLIARARADVQGLGLRAALGQLGHQRHDVRLRDRLPVADRQRMVVVGATSECFGHETVPRHVLHRPKHFRVGDVPAAEVLFDHASACLGKRRFLFGLRSPGIGSLFGFSAGVGHRFGPLLRPISGAGCRSGSCLIARPRRFGLAGEKALPGPNGGHDGHQHEQGADQLFGAATLHGGDLLGKRQI